MKKSFSLIEILFVIAVISIILIVALPKVDTIFQSTHMTQIKATITLIREGIVKEKNKLFLANNLDELISLDDGDEKLFSKVLSTPIIESSQMKANSWIRVSDNSYKVYIDDTQSVLFTYDNTTFSFDCDYDEPLCQEITE